MIIRTKETPSISSNEKGAIGLFNNLVKLDSRNYICIAACPGMGKTSLALYMALDYATKSHKTVYIFSLEMSAEQIRNRLIAQSSEEQLKELNIVIDDTTIKNVEEMRKKLEQEENLGLVIVDYLLLLSSSAPCENRKKEISIISWEIASLSRKLNVPILVTTQLNRYFFLHNRRPSLADLRDHGSFEIDTDTLIFLYQENYSYDAIVGSSLPEVTQLELIVAKNGLGNTGTVTLEWFGPYGKFNEIKD